MTSLNRQRANIVFSALLDSDRGLALELDLDPTTPTPSEKKVTLLTPAQVSKHERIFHRDGALQWTQHSSTHTTTTTHDLGSAQIGVSMSTFLGGPGSGNNNTSFQHTLPLQRVAAVFANELYILFLVPLSNTDGNAKWHASILLKRGCAVEHQLKAWTHALLAARVLARITMGSSVDAVLTVVEGTLALLNTDHRFETYLTGLSGVGWDVDIAALETRGGRRVDI